MARPTKLGEDDMSAMKHYACCVTKRAWGITHRLLLLAWMLIGLNAQANFPGFSASPSTNGISTGGEVGSSSAWEDAEAIETYRESILEQIKNLQEIDQEKPSDRSSADDTQSRINLLQRLSASLAQQLSVIQEGRDAQVALENQEANLERLREQGTIIQEMAFAEYDALADQLRLEEERLRQAKDRYHLAIQEADRAWKVLHEKESAYRLQREVANSGQEQSGNVRLGNQLAMANLERELAEVVASTRRHELNLEKMQKLLTEKNIEVLRLSRNRAKGQVTFSEEELQERLAVLDDVEEQLGEALRQAENGMSAVDLQLQDAMQADPSDPVEQAHMEAVRQERQFRQRQVTVINMRLQRVVEARRLWDRRFRLFKGGVDADEKSRWGKEARQVLDQLTTESRLQRARLDEMRDEKARIDASIEEAESRSEIKKHYEERKDWLMKQVHLAEENLGGIDRTLRLAQKLLGEAEGESSSEKLSAFRERLWDGIRAAWNFELAVIDERPITIRKILTALLVFVLGARLSRWFSRRMVAGLLRRTKIDASGSAAVQSIFFYILVMLFAVTALYLTNIPLGLFTLLGGALAIGLGFGSQNIINNFISGLILMLERPIRVGDMVEVEGTYGQVLRIGARCTQVQTGNSIDLMVPNSVFLESNVINWTLSDDRFRCVVSVGVAYGSPTRTVEKILHEAALVPPRVQPHPPPKVIFKDFGDNALVFEVHFWIRMKSQIERFSVESAVRFEIDERFRAAGLTIAFPQRDVHLNTLSPLDVRVLSETESQEST